jgi:hypothetical protein
VECCIHVLGDSIDLGAMLKEEHDNVNITET